VLRAIRVSSAYLSNKGVQWKCGIAAHNLDSYPVQLGIFQ